MSPEDPVPMQTTCGMTLTIPLSPSRRCLPPYPNTPTTRARGYFDCKIIVIRSCSTAVSSIGGGAVSILRLWQMATHSISPRLLRQYCEQTVLLPFNDLVSKSDQTIIFVCLAQPFSNLSSPVTAQL